MARTLLSARGLTASSPATSSPAIRSAWRFSPAPGTTATSRIFVRRLLARASVVDVESADYEAAAGLYRTCRRRGETVRKLIDCLIAALAIRAGTPVLHKDADFDVLARHTPLRIDQPSAR